MNRQAPLQAYPKTATPAETPNMDDFDVSQLSADDRLPSTLELAIDPRLIIGPHATRLKTDKNYSYLYPTLTTIHYRDHLVYEDGELQVELSCSACNNNYI